MAGPQDAFLALVQAAIQDVVKEGQITQLALSLTPAGTEKRARVRLVIQPATPKETTPDQFLNQLLDLMEEAAKTGKNGAIALACKGSLVNFTVMPEAFMVNWPPVHPLDTPITTIDPHAGRPDPRNNRT